MKILLDSSKPFYKANLHCHSTKSDGKKTVEELKAEFKKNGYSVVAFTDHEHIIDNSYLDDDEFLTITSCEVAIKQFKDQSTLKNFNMHVAHLNFYALDQHNDVTPCYNSVYDHFINDSIKDIIKHEGEYDREYSAEKINEMISIAKSKGFIVSYNHPGWSLENATDYMDYDGMFAVEIYNHSCYNNGLADDEHVFDDFLRAGKKIYCTACDDCHNNHDFGSVYNDSFGGWICINADKLDYDTIMNALQSGDFYASTGPEIKSLTVDGNKVRIETSDCAKIVYLTKGRRRKTIIAEKGEKLNCAEFEMREADEYFRIRVEDGTGKKAYTQSYEV